MLELDGFSVIVVCGR